MPIGLIAFCFLWDHVVQIWGSCTLCKINVKHTLWVITLIQNICLVFARDLILDHIHVGIMLFFFVFIFFGGGATPRGALHSEITPGGSRGHLGYQGVNPIRMHTQGNCPTCWLFHCAPPSQNFYLFVCLFIYAIPGKVQGLFLGLHLEITLSRLG